MVVIEAYRVTREQLVALGACAEGLAAFDEAYPSGVVTDAADAFTKLGRHAEWAGPLMLSGSGSSSGYGDGYGDGYSDGDGYGYGSGSGSGYGDGDGYGSGSGSGSGYGDGYGDGYGYGSGDGNGYGYGRGAS